MVDRPDRLPTIKDEVTEIEDEKTYNLDQIYQKSFHELELLYLTDFVKSQHF